MKKIAASLAVVAALFATSAHATSYTNCLAISKPTPGDPTVANVWGSILNTNFDLIDTGIAQTLPLSVTGGTVTLTTANGATDQSRYKIYALSGTLTSNELILFPPSPRCGAFSVRNGTSGAFSVTIGVSNGSGGVLGTSIAVPQGGTVPVSSDGTNIVNMGGGAGNNNNITQLLGLTTPLAVSEGGTGATSLAGAGIATLGANTFTGVQTISNTAASAGLLMSVDPATNNRSSAVLQGSTGDLEFLSAGTGDVTVFMGTPNAVGICFLSNGSCKMTMDTSGNLVLGGALNPTNASGTRTNLGLQNGATTTIYETTGACPGSANTGDICLQY